MKNELYSIILAMPMTFKILIIKFNSYTKFKIIRLIPEPIFNSTSNYLYFLKNQRTVLKHLFKNIYYILIT